MGVVAPCPHLDAKRTAERQREGRVAVCYMAGSRFITHRCTNSCVENPNQNFHTGVGAARVMLECDVVVTQPSAFVRVASVS